MHCLSLMTPIFCASISKVYTNVLIQHQNRENVCFMQITHPSLA